MPAVHHKFASGKYFSDRVQRVGDKTFCFKGAESVVIDADTLRELQRSKNYYAARRLLRQHYYDYQIKDAFYEIWVYCHNKDAAKNFSDQPYVNRCDNGVDGTPFRLTRRELAASSII